MKPRLKDRRDALHRIMGQAQALQRLISSCPQLADLTLEECPGATEVTVTSARLRRFAMVCCHNNSGVTLQSRRLRSLRYEGGHPPTSSFLSVANHATIAALTIDVCEDVHAKTPRQITAVTELIGRCTNLGFLHLALRPAMAHYSSMFASVLRRLPHLRRLELKGCLGNERSVQSVIVLLQCASILEELSLFTLLPDPPEKKN